MKNGALRYYIELYHDGLHEHQTFKSADYNEATNKAELHIKKCGEKYKRAQQTLVERDSKLNAKEIAEQITSTAKDLLNQTENILLYTLNPTFDLTKLKPNNHGIR